jgi:polyisoprenoid-binding protein YceI
VKQAKQEKKARNEIGLRTGFITAALVISMLGAASAARAAEYKIDGDHTTIGFRVRHLFTAVDGRFDKYDGIIRFDPAKPEEASVEGTIDAASINTNVAERDKHLRSADFFDVANHPKITFKSTKVIEVAPDKTRGKMAGLLGIRGVEKEVILDVAFHGQGKDPWGNFKAGFSATTRIQRKDFGLKWNDTLETGGLLVGDDVEIRLEVEASGNP